MIIKTNYDNVILQEEGEQVSDFFKRVATAAYEMAVAATDFNVTPVQHPRLTHVRLGRQPAEGDRYADLPHRPLMVSLGVTAEREA